MPRQIYCARRLGKSERVGHSQEKAYEERERRLGASFFFLHVVTGIEYPQRQPTVRFPVPSIHPPPLSSTSLAFPTKAPRFWRDAARDPAGEERASCRGRPHRSTKGTQIFLAVAPDVWANSSPAAAVAVWPTTVDYGEDDQLPPVRGGCRQGLLDTPRTRPGEQRRLDPGGALVWDPTRLACAQGPPLLDKTAADKDS